MNHEDLQRMTARGWRFMRDGSTATAAFYWEDPDDLENGWELQILKSEGHRPRFTLEPSESGLTERGDEDLERLSLAITEARELMARWQGELPEDGNA